MRLAPRENRAKDYRRARELRNTASPVEQKLWHQLRDAAKAGNLKFRRQQPVHPYIADFACMAARLLVELDGDSHLSTVAYDERREAFLRNKGFTVLRFTNDEVVQNAEGVAIRIVEQAQYLLNAPLPDPPREGEGILSSAESFFKHA
jgi:very-short-patch-repair endonuclease